LASSSITAAAAAWSRPRAVPSLSFAWVLRNPGVSAPIVGATKPHHLSEAVAALDIELTEDEARTLEEPYVQQGPSWF
jgi:aryl-alcohol dehydrogenase-like predicted oxidoreductase